MSIDPANLAHRVRARRQAQNLGMRGAAAAAGVSPATLSRVERGDYVPGRDNLMKLAAWLDVPVDELVHAGSAHHEGEPQSTLEAVALHLRADKKLSADDAAVLEEVFRRTYDALVKRTKVPR
jgi:transcriptional regulator with XRE-family HTH domain